MEIKLKKIYVSEQLSDETTAFVADLYINNVKIGRAENEGRGGPTNYSTTTEEGRKLIREAEEWCKTLPPLVSKDIIIDNKPFTMPMSLELFIDNILSEHVRQMDIRRFQRKMERDMTDGIVFGVPDQEYRKFKFKVPIALILKRETGIKVLQSLIHERVLPLLKEGEMILNTNIPADIVQRLAIPEGKITRAALESDEKKRAKSLGRETSQATGKKKSG